MFGLSLSEIIVIALIAFILFGNKNLPQHLKKFFHEFTKLKKTFSNAQRSWLEVKNDIQRHIILEEKSSSPIKEAKPYSVAIPTEREEKTKAPIHDKEADGV
ncbi:MAG: twin-arginine translocase TatA/TatE family subunit [Silvanigrellaceae bacterium]|nr:twin-arginine translocase TatA/TatE family subunit [Silvanigrellaceae bacterium]